MDSLLHIAGTLITLIFLGAVIYSLTSSYRKRRKKAQRKKDLETKQHIQVKNLHHYDIPPQNGYCRYPLDCPESLRRFPQRFTALSIELANEQPYSICLIGFADFEKGELKDTHYFYVQPPENKLSNKALSGISWETLSKADEFGEYWNAGMKAYFTGRTLVAHNAHFVMGCIVHALKIYGIDAPCLRFIDTLDVAKSCYRFDSNKLPSICHNMNIELEEHNALSAASATGQFLLQAKRDYPMYIPAIYFANGVPSEEERLASLISVVEREECTAAEMFAPYPTDNALIEALLHKRYIIAGNTPNTYYATDAGLDFAESLP